MRDERDEISPQLEETGRRILDAVFAVHRALGPGLLESTYEACLAHALVQQGHKVDRQLALPVTFAGIALEAGYRIDMLVDDSVVLEIKAVETLAPIHDAQLLTYMRHSGRRLGYLLNFNVVLMKQGIRRKVYTSHP